MIDHDPGRTWELGSNKGWQLMRCKVVGQPSAPTEAGVLVEILLFGQSWDRLVLADKYELTSDYEIRLPQMFLSVAALRRLEHDLRSWVLLPLDDLRSTPLAVSESLGMSGQRVDITFGDLEGVVNEGHPGVSIRYATSKLEGTVSYVTDQSCIRIFAEGLGSFLRTYGPSSGAR